MINLLSEIGILIIVATILAYIAKLLKQPFIPAYILAGLIMGPLTGIISSDETISLLSEMGLVFLLFLAGLELDFNRLRSVGFVSLLGGSMQITSLFGLGYLTAWLFGFAPLSAVYIALIIAFSSTMVVVKLLSDKRELDTLHGRISMGILLTEDLIAIFALTVLTTVNNFEINTLIFSLVKGIDLVIFVYLVSKFFLNSIFKSIAKNPELLFLSSLTICFALAMAFNLAGFSMTVGAFVAGVALANLPYNFEIIGKVTSLKNFFATLFFVSLGLQIVFVDLVSVTYLMLALFFIVLFVKPLVTLFICSLFGYKRRVSLLVSLYLAQISEFSLVIVAQGVVLGHVSSSILTMTILAAIVTTAFTSYSMKYSNYMYKHLNPYLAVFDKVSLLKARADEPLSKEKHDIVVCGYNRIGHSIVNALISENKDNLLVVDFNPDVISRLQAKSIPCLYGDAGDYEIITRINPKSVKMLVSTVPTLDTNTLLLQNLRAVNKNAVAVVTASQVDEALQLYESGADYVILPHLIGGYHVSSLVKDMNKSRFKSQRNKIIRELNEFKHLGFDHGLR